MMKFIIPAACAAALAGIAVVTMIVGALETAKTVVYLENMKI